MKAELEEQLEPHMMTADGFEDCIIGIAERCGSPNLIAYDAKKNLEKTR